MPPCARQEEIARCGKWLACFRRFSLSSSTAATTSPSLSRTAAASCHQLGSNVTGSSTRKGEPLIPKTNNGRTVVYRLYREERPAYCPKWPQRRKTMPQPALVRQLGRALPIDRRATGRLQCKRDGK